MRFVVCGEALIDLIPVGGNDSPQESAWRAVSGGGPMNTAVALSRLGEPVEFLGRFGSDAFATQLRDHLSGSGVGLGLAVHTDEPTSLAVVSLDGVGKASYTFHFDHTANFGWQAGEFPSLDAADWLHFGSIGAVVAPGADALLGFLRTTEATLSYDINVRPTVLPDRVEYWDRVSDIMAIVGSSGGVVKASDEDISLLLDDPDADVLDVAEQWASEYGLALFVVTLGPDGAVAVKPDGRRTSAPGRSIHLVDTVGAGDTFMAGFLSAYVHDPHDVQAALARGIGASAIVCTRQGANPPTRAELDAFLALA